MESNSFETITNPDLIKSASFFTKYILYYLLTANVLGFLVGWLDFKYHAKSEKGKNPFILTNFITIVGGCIGTCLAFLYFDRKLTKENLTSRIINITFSIIEVILLIAFYSPFKVTKDDIFANIFAENTYLLYYLLAINFITFSAFGIDKAKAVADKQRIRIVTLLGLSAIGGSIGGIIAMYLFKHKTNKTYFTLGLPLILLTQFVVLGYVRGLGLF